MLKKRYVRYTSIVLAASLMVSGYFWYSNNPQAIVPYEEARDSESLLEIYKQNHFWLTSNQDLATAHKDFARSLATSSPSAASTDQGDLSTFVYHQNGQTKGFVSYYLESPTQAKILYIAVHKNYRRKGCAAQLLQYAIDKLTAQGITTITLVTRLSNKGAQALYKKYGFRAVWVDDTYVYFERACKIK